jgi:hypothetical protein
MKGTISPELKAIMRNPEWRKKFMLAMDFPDDFTLELEPGVFVTIKRFHNMPHKPKKKRSLWELLFTKN